MPRSGIMLHPVKTELMLVQSSAHSRYWLLAPGKRTLFLWLLIVAASCLVLVPVQLVPVLARHTPIIRLSTAVQLSGFSDGQGRLVIPPSNGSERPSEFSLLLLSEVIAKRRNEQLNATVSVGPAIRMAFSTLPTLTTTRVASTTTPPRPIARVLNSNGLKFEPYFVLNVQPCSAEVDVIVCVHSNPVHSEMRQTVRETWANQKHWPKHVIRTVFFVGRVATRNASAVEAVLKAENSKYGDVIQADFLDTYRNLTLKAVSALHWVTGHCANTKYMLKADDDVLVNTFSLQSTLFSNFSTDRLVKRQVACCTFKHYPVLRKGKWAATKSEISDGDYPTYCAGMAYATLTHTAVALSAAVVEEPFFWIDDVYVTGYLAARINATFNTVAVAWSPERTMERLNGKYWRGFYFFHARSAAAVKRAWQKLLKIGTADSNNKTVKSTSNKKHKY